MTTSTGKKCNLLFPCTGNSARSVLGEYLLKRIAPTRFNSFSAGASPEGEIHPMTIRVLKEFYKIDATDARSKSWEEFKDGNPVFDFVITVCDNAKASCPIWPGQPMVAHGGSPDPAAFEGFQRRIDLFTSLPLEKLDRLKLIEAATSIGSKEMSIGSSGSS